MYWDPTNTTVVTALLNALVRGDPIYIEQSYSYIDGSTRVYRPNRALYRLRKGMVLSTIDLVLDSDISSRGVHSSTRQTRHARIIEVTMYSALSNKFSPTSLIIFPREVEIPGNSTPVSPLQQACVEPLYCITTVKMAKEGEVQEHLPPRKTKHKEQNPMTNWIYDILLWTLSVLVDLFFREVHPRGSWKVPRRGPLIFVAAPHANQVCYSNSLRC